MQTSEILEREKRIIDRLSEYKRKYGMGLENAFTNVQEAEAFVKTD